MNLTRTTIAVALSAPATKATGLTVSTDPLAPSHTLTLTDGQGDLQANQQWHTRQTLAPGASETFDLAGALRDAFGDVAAFARLKAILLRNASATGTLTLGGGANPLLAWFGGPDHTLTLRPGGLLLLACTDAAAYPVTPGSADLLRLHNDDPDHPLTFELALVGTT